MNCIIYYVIMYDCNIVFFSGESGAGKTESTKLLLRQLMELCRANSQLEQQILQVSDPATLI